MPGFIRTTDPNDLMIKFIIEAADIVLRGNAIVFNTSNELESQHNYLASIDSDIWKEDMTCLEWLESKKRGSVIYVNFGSFMVMTLEQLLEFALGLANSKQPFVQIISFDLVFGGSVILSSKFVNETSDRGLIASWCPQEQVLNHSSIGGFLTQCGRNSKTESTSVVLAFFC